jgi:glycosyltransferase involved in cell wall biosynthesis
VAGGILADARWLGPHGVGRFAREVLNRISGVTQLTGGPKPHSVFDPIWLSNQIRARRPAVFFSPGFNPPAICNVPLVFTIHDLIHLQLPALVRLPVIARWKRSLYYSLLVRPASNRAYRVMTVSEYSRTEILKWSGLPEECVVNVGNGVDSTFRPDGPRYDPGFPYILYVGNRYPHKNVNRILQAFKQINAPEVRLILSGVNNQLMKELLRHYNLEDRVEFAGFLRDEQLPPLYRGAHLLIMPSLMEGFGLPALEAMACGTAVVASRTTSLPEVVGEAGLLVDPLDVDDIRRGMERVLGDTELRQRMSQAGLQQALRFSWDRVGDRVRHVIEGAAGTSDRLFSVRSAPEYDPVHRCCP